MKRRLTKLVVFLLLGVIVNVAVAWGCALWLPMDNLLLLSEKQVRQRIPPDVTVRSDLFFVNGSEIKQTGRSILMLMATEVDSRGLDSAVLLYWELRAGWPTISLDHTYKMTEAGLQYPFSLYLPEALMDRVRRSGLPLRPQWPGFAANTIFYAAVLWMLTLGPFTARRMIRRKRGHCIKCGYDLRGTSGGGCSECGWRREGSDESKG